MKILTVGFEEAFTVNINGETIQIIAFKTMEPGNIKFGINAPKSIKVHREEVYQAIKLKEREPIEA